MKKRGKGTAVAVEEVAVGVQTNEELRKENIMLRNVFYVFFISGICSPTLGSLIPFLRVEYGFDYDTAGILISMQSAGNLISILLAGMLPAYVGRRKSVLLMTIWMTVSYVIFAGVLRPVGLVILASWMLGFARGGGSTFGNTMVSTLPDERATSGYTRLHGSFALGALLAPLLLVICGGLWPEKGWRVMTVILLVLSITQTVVCARMEFPPENPTSGGKRVDWSFFRDKGFWICGALLFCYISTEYAIMGWLVTYFQDIGVLSEDVAQLMSSLVWAMMFLGRYVGAKYSHCIAQTKLLLIDGVGLMVFFLVMFFSRTPGIVIIGLAGVGLFMATIYPTAFALGNDIIKGNDAACGMMGFMGVVGGMVTPALVGFVAKAAGIQAGMACIVVSAGVLMVMIFIAVWTRRNPAPSRLTD